MGASRVISAVADTGPFIHLVEIGCLPLLNIIDTLHIPEAVWIEATEKGRVPQDNLMEFGNIQKHTVPHLEVTRFIQEITSDICTKVNANAFTYANKLVFPLY